ncbi:hypothetical protein Tco_0923690 [Tanacetum coccineum]|uniref:Uncharacterized protein n=1 Tax=Tanacetum coccineum TaxID=301880 RepID=A0ABQ5D4Z7_9ASTR
MMHIDTPCRETISLMYNLVRISVLSVSWVGMKCADLVRRSTMTRIMSCPFEVLGSFVTQSTVSLLNDALYRKNDKAVDEGSSKKGVHAIIQAKIVGRRAKV